MSPPYVFSFVITELLTRHVAVELKITFPSLPWGVHVTKFWPTGVSRSDVCKFWDLSLKGRNTTSFLFPSLLVGMLM